MADEAIRFRDVRLQLPDGRELLHGISLDIAAESVTALLGRSGSGKTTLLRMVNGLVLPTSGTVTVHGKDVADADPIALRRGMGYVIQETGLFPHMTVERNVGLSYELAGRSRDDARAFRARIDKVLAMTGLRADEFRQRYPWQLSGGQRQRVGLARALMNDPTLLLMDEPFGALDPITRAEIQTMLHELLRRVRKTVLIVTHDLEEALFLADRVLFLEEGSVAADLPTAEVRASQHPVVRQYVAAVRHGEPATVQTIA